MMHTAFILKQFSIRSAKNTFTTHATANVATWINQTKTNEAKRLDMMDLPSMLPVSPVEDSPNDRHHASTSGIHKSPLLWWHKRGPQMDPAERLVDYLQKMDTSYLVKNNIITGSSKLPKQKHTRQYEYEL